MNKLVALLLPVTLALGCIGASTQNSVYAKETKNEDVTIEMLPESIPEDFTEEDMELLVNGMGFKKMVLNDDGSASITMSAERAKEFGQQALDAFEGGAQSIVDDETNSVTNIRWNAETFEYFEIVTTDQKMTESVKKVVKDLEYNIKLTHNCFGIEHYEYEIVVLNKDTDKVIDRVEANV